MTARVWRVAAARLAASAAFVAAVGVGTFALARLAPDDPTFEMAASGADEAAIAAARTRLGLDQSWLAHLGVWVRGVARLDLGESSRFRRPVAELLADRTLETARLAATALVVATAIGLPLGVITGSRPRGVANLIVTPIAVALVSCPPVVGALVLLWASLNVSWPGSAADSIVVPALALALPLAAMLERVQSRAMSEVIGAPDLVAGAARGISRTRLLWMHAARRALHPVLGIYGVLMGGLFSGSLAVEWITNWNGLGRLTYDALVSRDVFLMAGCALAGATLLAVANLLVDLLRAAIDPRVGATT